MTRPTGAPDRLTSAAFSAAVLIGGVNFVAVRYSNRELAPFFGAGIRFAAAAVLLVAFVVIRRIGFPRGRALWAALAYGVLSFAVTYALIYWALQELAAGVSAVIFAATPLVTIVLAGVHRLERFSRRGLVGAITVVIGIVVLANPAPGTDIPVIRLLAVLGATVAAAEAVVIMKLVPPVHPVATNATAMGLGAFLLLVVSAISGERWIVPEIGQTWLALSYLVFFGSVGLFGLILFTLGRWTASAVAYMTPLFPVVAMIAGAVIADESITLAGVVGGAIVLAGVYVGALRPGSGRGTTAIAKAVSHDSG